MYNIGNKNCDMPTTKCKIKFFKVQQSFCTAKSKNKSDTLFIHTFSKNLCFNSSFKNRFQEAFLIKVINAKKIHYLHLTL